MISMLKQDKIDLRREMLNGTSKSDEHLARLYDCTISTVRKYRKTLHPDSKGTR